MDLVPIGHPPILSSWVILLNPPYTIGRLNGTKCGIFVIKSSIYIAKPIKIRLQSDFLFNFWDDFTGQEQFYPIFSPAKRYILPLF